MPLRRRITGPAMLAITVLVISCSSAYRSMSVEEKRAHLEELEHQTLDELVEQRPEAREDLDAAVGYAIFSKTATKVPIVGTGEGLGVVVNKATGTLTLTHGLIGSTNSTSKIIATGDIDYQSTFEGSYLTSALYGRILIQTTSDITGERIL